VIISAYVSERISLVSQMFDSLQITCRLSARPAVITIHYVARVVVSQSLGLFRGYERLF